MEPNEGKGLSHQGFTIVSFQGFDLPTVLVMDVHRIQGRVLLAKSRHIIRIGDVDRDAFDGLLQAEEILHLSKQVVLASKQRGRIFVMGYVVVAPEGS